MEIVECNIIITHVVHKLPCILISQKGWVAFDEGMYFLLLNQVTGNALNLLGRTSVKGGKGCTVADLRGNPLHVFLCHLLKLIKVVKKPLPALIENRRPGCILHALDELVNLFQLNAFQVISN